MARATVTRVDWRRQALEPILKGTEGRLRQDLDARGERVARRAGSGYEAQGWVGRTRYRVTVRSTDPVKITASPLVAALDAGRGR